jgi:hypothetical protein
MKKLLIIALICASCSPKSFKGLTYHIESNRIISDQKIIKLTETMEFSLSDERVVIGNLVFEPSRVAYKRDKITYLENIKTYYIVYYYTAGVVECYYNAKLVNTYLVSSELRD